MNTNPMDQEPQPSQAEAVAASIEIGAESARVIQHVLSQASNIESRKRVLASYLEAGPAFAAYLLLEESAADGPDLAAQFAEAYVSSWETLDQLADTTLEGLGWSQALSEFCVTQGIDQRYLDWNRQELLTRIKETYDVIELDGFYHAFYT